MEGEHGTFTLFNQCKFNDVEELMKFFPFNDNDIQIENENFNFFILPDVDVFEINNHHKILMDGDVLLEKISKFEENYNNIIQNNFMVSPTSSINYYLIKRRQ